MRKISRGLILCIFLTGFIVSVSGISSQDRVSSAKGDIKDLQKSYKNDLSVKQRLEYVNNSYIVEMEESSSAFSTQDIGTQQDNLINDLEIQGIEFNTSEKYKETFKGFNIALHDNKSLEEIRQDPRVEEVHRDKVYSVALTDAKEQIGAEKNWDKQIDGMNLTGQGVNVSVLDTGVDYTHPGLGNCTETEYLNDQCEKVIGGYDFVNNDSNPIDNQGHGTHVAGIVAGNGDIKGVAPGANIQAYKVLNSEGSGSTSDIIEGIENATQSHSDIIVMSLGGSGNPGDPLSTAVDNAVEDGVLAVVAAGNNGPGRETISTPGTAEKALTVGAVDSNNNIADFSSRGPVTYEQYFITKPDVVAPGVNICAPRYGDFADKCGDGYAEASGTSMATPMVAGAAAILYQKNNSLESMNYDVMDMRSQIISNADDLGYETFKQGGGLVNITRTLENNHLSVQENPIDLETTLPGESQTKVVDIENKDSEALDLNLQLSSATKHREEVQTDKLSLNTSSLQLSPGETREVEVQLPSDSQSGIYYGFLDISSNTSHGDIESPYAYQKRPNSSIDVEVVNSTSVVEPKVVKLYNKDGGLIRDISSSTLGNFTEYLEPGKYSVWALNSGWRNLEGRPPYEIEDPFILGESFEIGDNEEKKIELNISSAKEIEFEAEHNDRKLWLYDYAILLDSGQTSYSRGLVNFPVVGNKTLHYSNLGDRFNSTFKAGLMYNGVPSKGYCDEEEGECDSGSRQLGTATQEYLASWKFKNSSKVDPDYTVQNSIDIRLRFPYRIGRRAGQTISYSNDQVKSRFFVKSGHVNRPVATGTSQTPGYPLNRELHVNNESIPFELQYKFTEESLNWSNYQETYFDTFNYEFPDMEKVDLGGPMMTPPEIDMSNKYMEWQKTLQNQEKTAFYYNSEHGVDIKLRDETDDNLDLDTSSKSFWWNYSTEEDMGELQSGNQYSLDIEAPVNWRYLEKAVINTSFTYDESEPLPSIQSIKGLDTGFTAGEDWKSNITVKNAGSFNAYLIEGEMSDQLAVQEHQINSTHSKIELSRNSIQSGTKDLKITLENNGQAYNVTLTDSITEKGDLSLNTSIQNQDSGPKFDLQGDLSTNYDKVTRGQIKVQDASFQNRTFVSSVQNNVQSKVEGDLSYVEPQKCTLGTSSISVLIEGTEKYTGDEETYQVQRDPSIDYGLNGGDSFDGSKKLNLETSSNLSCRFKAYLQTNETGQWENKTGKYNSPQLLENGSASFNWANYSTGRGKVAWRVMMKDQDGNSVKSTSQTFTTSEISDDTPPDSQDDWDTENYVDKNKASIRITASDQKTDVSNITYWVNGDKNTVGSDEALVQITNNGNNTLKYYATDVKGNQETNNTEYVAIADLDKTEQNLEQDDSKQQTIDKQYIQKKIDYTNPLENSIQNIEILPQGLPGNCQDCNTRTIDLNSGETKTLEYHSEGDWIETTHSSIRTEKTVKYGSDIDSTYSFNHSFDFENTNSDVKFTDVGLSDVASGIQSCDGQQETADISPGASITREVQLECEAGSENSWDHQQTSTDSYEYTAEIDIPNHVASETRQEYWIKESRLENTSNILSTDYEIEGQSVGLTDREEDGYRVIEISETFRNGKSLDEGTHDLTLDYKVEQQEEEEQQDSGSGGGGGGGGGAGFMPPEDDQEDNQEDEQTQKDAEAEQLLKVEGLQASKGEEKKVDLADESRNPDSIEFKEVRFEAEKNIDSGEIEIETRDNQNVLNMRQYRSFHIVAPEVTDVTFEYSIKKDWIENNGLEPEQVKLYKKMDGEWRPRKTTVQDRSGTEVTYKSQLNGFSTFTVAAEDKESKSTGENPCVKDDNCLETQRGQTLLDSLKQINRTENITSQQFEEVKEDIRQGRFEQAENQIEQLRSDSGGSIIEKIALIAAILIITGLAFQIYHGKKKEQKISESHQEHASEIKAQEMFDTQ